MRLKTQSVDRDGEAEVERVRVWWPPSRDPSRTGFCGAYWPAAVVKKSRDVWVVQYDNEEQDKTPVEHIFPIDAPLDFGQEIVPLELGEFVEVSNGSKTDPCAWVGTVATFRGNNYVVTYPFHDSPDESIKPINLRRARVWDDEKWCYIQPGQSWRSGEVISPKELKLVSETKYYKLLKGNPDVRHPNSGKATTATAGRKRKAAAEAEEEEEEQKDAELAKQAAARPTTGAGRRKPVHPTATRQ